MTDRKIGLLAASMAAFMWALLAIFLKIALEKVPPSSIVFVRFFLAGLMVLITLGISGNLNKSIFKFPKLLWGGIFALAINYYFYLMGVHLTTASTAQIVIQFGPLLLALSGLFIFKEEFKKRKIVGLLFFICGFIFFYQEQLSFLENELSTFNSGVLYVFAGAVFWAIFAVIQKIVLKRNDPNKINLIIYAMASIIYLPISDFSFLFNLDLKLSLVLIFLGFNTFIAYGGISLALKKIPANEVSIIISLNPLLTIVLMQVISYFELFNIAPEALGGQGIIGACLLVLGALLVVIK